MLGWRNDYVYFFISISSLGSKWFLNLKNLKNSNIMALVLQIFPFANAEIVTAAVTCIFMTLFGLSLGFALLKVQGE